jgi:hypothetical protein
MMDENLYTLNGSAVMLSPRAKEIAQETWPEKTAQEAHELMAKHLLKQQKLRELGHVQGDY